MHKILKSQEPRAEPRAKSQEPRAKSQEPRAKSQEPRAKKPRAKSQEPRAKSQEPRAKSQEPRAKSQEPRAKSQEPRAKSQEPRARAKSQEPRAKSQEPRAQEPRYTSDLSLPARRPPAVRKPSAAPAASRHSALRCCSCLPCRRQPWPQAVTLVSNTGQGDHTNSTEVLTGFPSAQQFTTGDNTAGYTLTAVDIVVTSVSVQLRLRVRIFDNNNSNDPKSMVYELTLSGTVANGTVTFNAPANATLAANTKYHVHVAVTATGGLPLPSGRVR